MTGPARVLRIEFRAESLRVSDLQLFDLIGAFLNVREEQMPIRMF